MVSEPDSARNRFNAMALEDVVFCFRQWRFGLSGQRSIID
jgi:hypothetical protein